MRSVLLLLEVAEPSSRLGAPAGPDLTRYFGVLIVLVLAVVGLALGFKKLFARTLQARAAQRHLAIVDLLPLGGKQRLAIVRCYDRTFALGLGDKEVALVAEIDPVNVVSREAAAPTRADRAGFAQLLQRAFPQPPKPLRAAHAQATPHDAARPAIPEPAHGARSRTRAAPPARAREHVDQVEDVHAGKSVADLLSNAERLEKDGLLA